MDINSQIRHLNLRESKRKLVSLEIARRKRAEVNDLINKELRIRNGAQNLLNVCNNSQTEQRLKLELTFVDSKIKYLKDQLAELNCDWTLFKMKNAKNNKSSVKQQSIKSKSTFHSSSSNSSSYNSPTVSGTSFTNNYTKQNQHDSCISTKQFRPLQGLSVSPSSEENSIQFEFIPNVTNSDSFSPSSSSSSAITITPTETPIPSKSKSNRKSPTSSEEASKSLIRSISSHKFLFDENQEKSADLMIYLNLKETINNLDFGVGFKNFLWNHYKEEPCNYLEQIRQFNYFRETTIKLSYEPGIANIQRLFEYFNSLQLIEKRFFQNSQCNNVHFTWYDSINGVESTQKSIQFEKASVLFNCATLYTQLAAICCDGNDQKQEDQLNYWLKAAGCLKFLTINFSNSPSFDMSSFLLNFFIETFICQAYEVKAKILILNLTSEDHFDTVSAFCSYLNCSRLYSHVSERYTNIFSKLETNTCIKTYIPEIWYYIIKVKSIYYKGLSHYYAAMALMSIELESIKDNSEIVLLFETLHDRRPSSTHYIKNLNKNNSISTIKYLKKMEIDTDLMYNAGALENENRFHLARAHMKESASYQEEALRQHGFCRKFSSEDYLHHLLQHYYDSSLEKLLDLEKDKTEDFDDEMFDVLPINPNLSEVFELSPIEPKLQHYEFKDFFNLIGPVKIYSSEFDTSMPYSCVLKKQPSQRTFGITVKGDCPVRINNVDPQSYAYNIGIREGSFIIGIQDQDVRWAKHCEVVEKIRSNPYTVKLTLVNIREFSREVPIYCDESQTVKETNMINEIENIRKKNVETTTPTGKTIYSSYLNSSQNENYITKKFSHLIENSTPSASIRQRLFKSSKLTNFPPAAPPSVNSSNLVMDAANKLYNLAKTTGSTVNLNNVESSVPTLNTYKSERYNVSINNVNGAIRFNPEDDEIVDKENLLFWQNMKSLKTPLTNTITLGRKFKRNVLKLSIFNSFSNLHDKAPSKGNLDTKEATEPVAVEIKPTQSYSKNKLLKKRKKLKDLEKNNMDAFKKINADKKTEINQLNNTGLNTKSSIYKTL